MISLPPTGIPVIANYIDLGTGSMVLQIAIASLVGAIFMLKIFWRRVKLFLSKLLSNLHLKKGHHDD